MGAWEGWALFLIVSRTASGERVRWIATDTLTSARRWQAEFLAELDHGTVTIDEADSSAENRRRLYTAWIHRRSKRLIKPFPLHRKETRDMQAVTEYKNGSIDTRIFNNIRAHDAVGAILNDDGPENPAVRIWIVMDEVGETWDETQDPYWTAEQAGYLYICRKTDGCLARLTLAHTGLDLYSEICTQYPVSESLLDEDSIQWVEDSDDRTGGYDDTGAVFFDSDEDVALADWLTRWTAEAVELDAGHERVIGQAMDYPTRDLAIRRAQDVADSWINRQACDLAELVVVIRIGGQDVWCFEDSQWEDVE